MIRYSQENGKMGNGVDATFWLFSPFCRELHAFKLFGSIFLG